jgi:integrase
MLLAAASEIDAEQEWDGDLFRLVLVLAATGARFSQIVRLRIDDVQIARGRLMVPASRKGRGKSGSIPVPVGADVLDALRPAVTGRPGDAPLLERWRLRQVSGTRWVREDRAAWRSASELVRPWAAIRERAGLPKAIVPYALRHTSIVRCISANLPVRLVAASHDTSVSMIEAHYAKWITSGLEDLTRQAIVPLVPPHPDGNVRPLGGGA